MVAGTVCRRGRNFADAPWAPPLPLTRRGGALRSTWRTLPSAYKENWRPRSTLLQAAALGRRSPGRSPAFSLRRKRQTLPNPSRGGPRR